MRLPNCERAVVPKKKITEYLLSLTHREGRSKAQFFKRVGFSAEAWEELAEALKRHASEHELTRIEDSPFGKRYVIEGIIHAPDGRMPLIRSIWFVRHIEDIPQFATAYPLKRREK